MREPQDYGLRLAAWRPLRRLAPRALSVSPTRQGGTCDALPSKFVDKTNGSNPESQMGLPTATKMKRIVNISFFQRLWRIDDGGGMVEFAVAAAALSVLFLGIFEFGIAAWQKNSVASDVREGARYAAVRGTTSGRTATTDSVVK